MELKRIIELDEAVKNLSNNKILLRCIEEIKKTNAALIESLVVSFKGFFESVNKALEAFAEFEKSLQTLQAHNKMKRPLRPSYFVHLPKAQSMKKRRYFHKGRRI